MAKKLCFHMGYANLTGNNYGSEISLLKLAKTLARYYDVYIFSTTCQQDTILEGGIYYSNSASFEKFAQDKLIDVLIVSRYLNVFIDNTIRANKVYIWVHDVCFQASSNGAMMRDSGKHLYNNISPKVNGIIVLSDHHKQNMIAVYGIPEDKIHIIGHGIEAVLTAKEKIKRRFIYTSCPTRGLDLLLKILPKIHDEFNDVELYVYRDVSKEQREEINKYDYIHCEGFQSNETVREALLSAGVWLYPTSFVETFCLSALEAQASGCFCITTNMGSLSEIVGNRGVLIGNCYYGSDQYIEKVLETVRIFFESDLYDNKIVKAKEWADSQSWDNVCMTWLKLFGNDLEYKNAASVPQIPVSIINLEKQVDKWIKCQKDLMYSGVTNISRFSAIDGGTLVWGPELQNYFVLHDDNHKWIPHTNNAGIFGCAMSHIKLWENLSELSDDTVWMIVEDDMVPNMDFATNWTRIYNSIKDDSAWDMCYLGYLFFGSENILDTDDRINDEVYRLTKSEKRLKQNCGGTICYILRSSGAKKLLEIVKQHKIHRAIDWFLIDFYDKICAYLCWPLLVHPRGTDVSSVQGTQKTIPGIKNSFEFVDRAVYINLDFRPDRRAQVEIELSIIPQDKLQRLEVYKEEHGNIGSAKNHIQIIEMAIENKWKNCLIFEDDAMWKNFSAGYAILKKLIEQPYDVIMLGAHSIVMDTPPYKIKRAVALHAYIVSEHYYETLLENYKEGLAKLRADPSTYATHNIDMYISKLQEKDNWFCVNPVLCIQRASFSDTERRFTNYEALYN